MLNHAIDSIKVTGDNIELLYSVYRGQIQDIPTQKIKGEGFDLVSQFVADQKEYQATISFTRQNAFNIAMSMGAVEDANELKSITMEQIKKTYNHLLDAYLKTLYEPQS